MMLNWGSKVQRQPQMASEIGIVQGIMISPRITHTQPWPKRLCTERRSASSRKASVIPSSALPISPTNVYSSDLTSAPPGGQPRSMNPLSWSRVWKLASPTKPLSPPATVWLLTL